MFFHLNWPTFERALPEPAGLTLDLGSGEGRVGRELRRRRTIIHQHWPRGSGSRHLGSLSDGSGRTSAGSVPDPVTPRWLVTQSPATGQPEETIDGRPIGELGEHPGQHELAEIR